MEVSIYDRQEDPNSVDISHNDTFFASGAFTQLVLMLLHLLRTKMDLANR